MNVIQTFQPSYAIEIVAPKYGTGYRIGGRLVLTCRHLFDEHDNTCQVRFRKKFDYLDKEDIPANIIWKAPGNVDIALIELPKNLEGCEPITLGELPDRNSAEIVKFDCLGFPQFLRYTENGIKYATGLHIQGTINVANRVPNSRLLLNIQDNKAIQPTDKQLAQLPEEQSPWQGTSGAAIVCNGLVVGVQSKHPITDRPQALEAESLARVYDHEDWCTLLSEHGIDPHPLPVRPIKSSLYRNQAPSLPRYFVERPEVSGELKKCLLSQETVKAGTLVVSAIYGLGGIGKSVLATALAYDKAVQEHFPDGIFWATLGQQPDILSFLHSWIQALGDYHFQPTNIDAATLQLRTLLSDKKALLVVDDLWNPDDLDPFQVTGKGCQVLVTTREAPVLGAIRYDLDVMTQEQSLELLTSCLTKKLTTKEIEKAKTLAKTVGYLPLALELAAAQFSEGISWDELLSDLQAEIADLEVLDKWEAEDAKSEAKRKKYSLVASFNLSLKRLSSERLKQFAWLGVLPDDVTITEKMATTLWDCSLIKARKTLRYFRGKALLLPGVSSEEGTNYRLHDLLHNLARTLLQAPTQSNKVSQLPGLGLSVSQAHQQLLRRYQKQTKNGLWHSLNDDGYIYNQLIWHFQKAEEIAEIHKLLREETSLGVNGWYSQCQKQGKTANFIKDVSKAWSIAEENFLKNPTESISLQYRYALITTSFNSFAENITPRLIEALVKNKIWTPVQGLAYVRQNQDSKTQAEGLGVNAAKLSGVIWRSLRTENA